MQFFNRIQNINSGLILLGLIIIAAALRLYHLNTQSLWLDEIYTMNMADPANSWSKIYQLSTVDDPLSVLYFIVLNVCFKVFGFTAITARAFSTAFGLLSIIVLHKLAKNLFNSKTANYAALILVLNPFAIEYSQEARVYTMYLFATILSFYRLLEFIKAPTIKSAVLYGLTALLMVLSHFFGFFVLVSQVIVFAVFALRLKRVTVGRYLSLAGLSALTLIIGYLPIIPIFLWLTKSKGAWINPPGPDALIQLFIDFNGSSISLSVFGAILIALALLSTWFFKTNSSEKHDWGAGSSLVFVSIWLLISFLIPFLLSIFHFPIFYKRYLISILPAFVLLQGKGFDFFIKPWIRATLLVGMLGISYIALFGINHPLFAEGGYYQKRHKSDFRATANFIVENNAPQFKVFTSLPYHYGYYFRSMGEASLLNSSNLNDLISNISSGRLNTNGFWYTDAHGRGFELKAENQSYLDSNYLLYYRMDAFDAWARLYVKKEKVMTRPLIYLDKTNFFTVCSTCINSSFAIFANDTIESKIQTLDTGVYRLILRGASTPSKPINNTSAHITVSFGNLQIGDYYMSPHSFMSGDTLLFKLDKPYVAAFKLSFDNDTCYDEGDRNIILRDLQVFH